MKPSENMEISLKKEMAVFALSKELLEYILSFNDYWSLINARVVCKNWHRALSFTTFNKLEELYKKLREKKPEELEQVCIKDVKSFQALLMSTTLLTQLSLDQITAIACTSYEHAQTILKSKLFYDKPVPKPKLHRSPANPQDVIEDMRTHRQELLAEMEEMSNNFSMNTVRNVFDDLLKVDPFMPDYRSNLKRFDLVEEELNISESEFSDFLHSGVAVTSPSVSAKAICQAYIARSLAEKDAGLLRLAAYHAQYAFNSGRLLKLSKLSLPHAKAILDEPLSIGKLNAKMMVEMASYSVDHKKLMLGYAIHLLSLLPITLVKRHPHMARNVTTALMQGSFFSSNNPYWRQFSSAHPEKARRILEINKFLAKEQYLLPLFSKLMMISVDCAEAVLSVTGAERYVDREVLEKLSQKNAHYGNLLQRLRASTTGDVNNANRP